MSWARRRDQTRRRAGTAARWALTRARSWLAPHDDGATRPSAGPDTSDVNRMFEWCQATTGSRYRPQYLWPTLQSASSAKALGVPRISVVEFGVAGGNGLLALEEAAAAAESLLGIGVAVAGFDTGKGLPPPVDHRDVPFVLRPGYFEMDERALRDRLSRAELVLGPVAETLGPWLETGPAPVGFAAFDLDYWSSTVDALRLFDARDGVLLPRILCYFDDILGVAWGDFNGERAAIADFPEPGGPLTMTTRFFGFVDELDKKHSSTTALHRANARRWLSSNSKGELSGFKICAPICATKPRCCR